MTQVNLFKINKPIVLVGIMGAGKTSIGTRLAKKIGTTFYDTDQEVERIVGCTITDIFKYAGEDFFREKEREVVKSLVENNPLSVISTGGGSFIDDEIRKVIKEKSISIWLRADYESLIERLGRSKTRPALEEGNKEEIIKTLIDERYPIYAQADLCINSNKGPHVHVINEIIQFLLCLK